MPDSNSWRKFIWLVACLLFTSLLVGGGCLVAYMILPDTETTWIPVVGFTLVCLPWAFWFITFLYRIFSRCFGCRDGVANSYNNSGRGRIWDAANGSTQGNNADVEVAAQAKGLNRASSVASHESEMALAKSMAS